MAKTAILPQKMGKLNTLVSLIGKERRSELSEVLRHRWHSDLMAYGLRRDISVAFAAPEASIPITVRPLRDSDIPHILDPHASGLSDAEREERSTRMQILEAGFQTCYVAVTEEDIPCYMQWLIGPRQNSLIKSYWKGIFPHLEADEALLEGAFTPEAWRGKRIMPAAMAQIAEKGATIGAKKIITFVTHDNIASLKGCRRSGFAPYLVRIERWRSLRSEISFLNLPEY